LFLSFSHRKPPHHIHGPGLHICGPELIVEVRKDMARLTGYEWLCVTGLEEYPWDGTFSFRRVFSSAAAFLSFSWRNICGYDSIDFAMDCGFREHSSLQPDFVLDFFSAWRNRPLLSILLVPLFGAPFSSEQTGWLDFLFFSSLHPKDSGVLCSIWHGMLVFNDCIMEWVNIPSNGVLGGYQMQPPGQMGHGQKIPFRFLFLSLWSAWTRPLVAIKRGWLALRSTERFSILEIETQKIDTPLIWDQFSTLCCEMSLGEPLTLNYFYKQQIRPQLHESGSPHVPQQYLNIPPQWISSRSQHQAFTRAFPLRYKTRYFSISTPVNCLRHPHPLD